MVSVVKTVQNTDRLRQIVTVLIKHGFGQLIGRLDLRSLVPWGDKDEAPPRRTFAVRLREAAEELGPSFVKLGQIVSTRPDLIPADVIAELKKLQEDVPPMAADEVREVLAETFAGTENDLFVQFDDKPLASASIGQVHAARIRREDGSEVDVVVKVQRPRIQTTIQRDLDLLYLLAGLIERHVPESRIYSPSGLVGEFDRAIMAELDFMQEADNAERFARNFLGDARVRFPHVYRHASGKRVLTMERFTGTKIYEMARQDGAGERIAINALHVIARMIFEHGFFHADPHPGNIIMLGSPADPVIGLIDLGLVGRLSPEMRDRAISLMVAAVGGDPRALAEALVGMGKPRGRVDMEAFSAEVSMLSEKYLGRPVSQIEVSALIRDLVQGAIKYEIDMPVEMLMVGKALMTVEGIGKEIHPGLDVWTELRPYFIKLLRDRYSPERLGRDLLRNITKLGATAEKLPGQVGDILEDLRSGRLELKVRDPDLSMAGDRLGRRLHAAITTSAMLLGGVGLLVAGKYENLALFLLIFSAVHATFHLWRDLRRKQR
jgi:ubiquinone biosynthesis protein